MNKLFKTDGHGIIIGCTDDIKNIKNLIIPSEIDGVTITAIGAYTFSYCDNLVTVTIPDTVTEIERCAFEYCTSLKSIIIPDSVTKIGKGAFLSCTSLESIILPERLEIIDNNTFSRCMNLKYISIPDSVTKIGTGAFAYCDTLSTALFKGTKLDWSTIDIGHMNQKLEDCISVASIVYQLRQLIN